MVAIVRNTLAFICLAMALVTSALWLRNAWTMDNVYLRLSPSKSFRVVSVSGRLSFSTKPFGFDKFVAHNSSRPPTAPNVGFPDDYGKLPSRLWPQIMRWKSSVPPEVHVPCWILVVALLLLAVALATKRRFSLKAMIVATTIVAIVLGGVGAYSRYEAQHRKPLMISS
jgi:hypothetical protein